MCDLANDEFECIAINSIRVAGVVINHFKMNQMDISKYSSMLIIKSNLEAIGKSINLDLLRDQTNDSEKKINFEHLKSEVGSIIPETHFLWLKNDKRAAFWVWGQLFLYQKFNYSLKINNIIGSSVFNKDFDPYHHSRFCHDSRYDSILYLFDTQMNIQPKEKINIISNLYSDWRVKFTFEQPFRWLDRKNEDMCLWAYRYINEYQSKSQKEANEQSVSDSFQLPGEISSPTINEVSLPVPGDNEELFYSIFAMYDLWEPTVDRKKLFLINMNKAWNQKKVREGRKGKKAINTFISDDSKSKLDLLAKKYDMRLSLVLEKLIREKFHEENL